MDTLFMSHTILGVPKDGSCTGCATCAGICPNRAIKMRVDTRKGTFVPNIDWQNCNECGLCYRICPGHQPYFAKENTEIFTSEHTNALVGKYLNCYVGHASDHYIRHNSSSGGLVTQLLIYALDKGIIDGALVTKMSEKDPLRPKSFIARTEEEILSAAKSKYCPVPVNIALREVINNPGKYAVVGLPCQIQGVRKAEHNITSLKNRLILHFGLACNHVPTFLATEYLLKKLGVSKNQVGKIDYRSKGHPSNLMITLKNGRGKYVPHNSELYWGGAFSSFFYSQRCALCADKVCKFADISFMDAWLPEFSKRNLRESIIISRTAQGENLLHSTLSKKVIELTEIPVDKVIESENLDLARRRYSAYTRFLRQLHKETIIPDKPLSRIRLGDYLKAVSFPIRLYISERPNLWFLIDFYLTTVKFSKMHHA
jgi:coenzyme F420 hydrogenase subunit beta